MYFDHRFARALMLSFGLFFIHELAADAKKSDFPLDSVPKGVEVSIRLRNDTVIGNAKIEKVDKEKVVLLYRENVSLIDAFEGSGSFQRAEIDRQRIFRIATDNGYYSDLPLTMADHRAFETYYQYITERGDFVITQDREKTFGIVESEDYNQISLHTSEGRKLFYRANIRDCMIQGKRCNERGVVGIAPRGLEEFAHAIEKLLPAGSKQSSFGVGQYRNATGEKAADPFGASLKSKVVSHLTNSGHRVHDRDQLSGVLREKELSQKGVLQGKDLTLEKSVQSDYIISGSIEKSAGGKYRVVTNIVSTQSLAVVASGETYIEAADENADINAYTHRGLHANFTGGPGFSGIAASGVQGFDSLSIAGTGGFFQFRFGVAIEENLILGINIGGNILSEPNGSSSPDILTEKRMVNRTLGTSNWGPSLTYFTRGNYFVSGMLGASTAIYKDTKQEVRVNNGFAGMLGFGREWWVSEKFALGLSLSLHYTYIHLTDMDLLLKTRNGDVRDTDFSLSQFSVVIAFSASYN